MGHKKMHLFHSEQWTEQHCRQCSRTIVCNCQIFVTYCNAPRYMSRRSSLSHFFTLTSCLMCQVLLVVANIKNVNSDILTPLQYASAMMPSDIFQATKFAKWWLWTPQCGLHNVEVSSQHVPNLRRNMHLLSWAALTNLQEARNVDYMQ